MIHWLSADNTKSTAEDNQQSFLHYTELGWEATVGRLKVIRMISLGEITRKDTILTLNDRMFLYSNFCNVKPFEKEPTKEDLGLRPTNSNYTNWLIELYVHGNREIGPWRWAQDVPTILNFDYEKCNPPPCVVINHRIRGYSPSRNFEEQHTKSLVSMVMDLGYKPYIGGKYADSIDPRAEYVPKLRTLMSLVNHKNCVCFIGSGGPILLAQQCCRSKLVCLNVCCKECIDITTCKSCNFMVHPLFLSKYANFTGCQQFVVPFNDINITKQILERN
jgi:hypothetical protein